MKILHVITSLRTGGAEKLMVDLLPRLKEQGADVELCLFDGVETSFMQRLKASGITIHDFGAANNVYNPRNIRRLIKLIRAGNYDIIHTHNTAPQLFAAVASVLCSVVLCTTEHNTSNRRRGWRWYAPVDRWMYTRYKRIICCSKKAEINLAPFTSPQKCLTINNGICIKNFQEAEEKQELRTAYPEESKIITMVAGFRREKDQDTVIKALNYLPDNFHLQLVGDGVRKQLLENLTAEQNLFGRVHFLGVRSDIPEILKSSDYIVMSSHFEGLSLSSVEGMAVGKPMLASDVDGLKQVIENAGLLFQEGNSKELAELIMKLDGNPAFYKSVADACSLRAAEYDISKMADGYLSVYHSLLQ